MRKRPSRAAMLWCALAWLAGSTSNAFATDHATIALAEAANRARAEHHFDQARDLYLALLSRLRGGKDVERRIAALYDLGTVELYCLHFDLAEAHLHDGLQLALKLYGSDDPRVAVIRIELAAVASSQEHTNVAESESREALRVLEATRGPDDSHTLRAARLLSGILVESSRFAEAAPLLRRLATWDPSNLAETKCRLGIVLFVQGEFDEARRFLREGFLEGIPSPADLRPVQAALVERELARTRAICAAYWGQSLLKDGHAQEAIAPLEVSLTHWRTSGDARARNALADAQAVLGRAMYYSAMSAVPPDQETLSEAERLARDALTLHKELYGDEDGRVADDLHELGSVLLAEGQIGEAEPLLRNALAMYRQRVDDESATHAVRTGLDLYVALRGLGNTRQAEEERDSALALFKTIKTKDPEISAYIQRYLK